MSAVGFDTNILAYMSGVKRSEPDEAKQARALRLIDELPVSIALVVPVQALGELFAVMIRLGRSTGEVQTAIHVLMQKFTCVATDTVILGDALALVNDHNFQSWDAIILCAAQVSGCEVLLSEDMQHGFVYRNTTIVNPLLDQPHPKLARLLALPDPTSD